MSQRPGEGWVLGGHDYLLGALGCLALALVIQDALDQVMVLIQHLEESKQGTRLSHGSWFTSRMPGSWGARWATHSRSQAPT